VNLRVHRFWHPLCARLPKFPPRSSCSYRSSLYLYAEATTCDCGLLSGRSASVPARLRELGRYPRQAPAGMTSNPLHCNRL
jgi:hypothetical protein